MPAPNSITEVARFGLAYERQRLEAASYNLAIANVALSASDSAAPRTVSVHGAGFLGRLGQAVTTEQQAAAPAVKIVHDPANALADAAGDVRYPDIEQSQEMATLVSATRAYEANVRAFNMLHQIEAKALEIGGRR